MRAFTTFSTVLAISLSCAISASALPKQIVIGYSGGGLNTPKQKQLRNAIRQMVHKNPDHYPVDPLRGLDITANDWSGKWWTRHLMRFLFGRAADTMSEAELDAVYSQLTDRLDLLPAWDAGMYWQAIP